jgi:SAM-dependent methyltransferase
MLPYALTIFTGAFLLFQVQPLIGKYILPWFGGGPGVWTTCLLFFQMLLLGGYAYAHFSSTRLKPKGQAALHLALLVLALALLPITPAESWKTHLAGNPTWHILLLLTATIGLPYFVLSSTGPLMQQWFSQTNPGVSPYRLYALSNIGSLLALLSYPFFFEVEFSRHAQAALWSAGLGLFVLLAAFCAWRVWRHGGAAAPGGGPADPAPAEGAPTPWSDRALWLALPAIASVLLLATTNKLCQEVAVVPFLWVLPLALYLLSFIVCFDHARWYRRGVFVALVVLGTAVVCDLLSAGNDAPLTQQIIGYTAALFVACMACHGELYRLKPPPRELTSFYLLIAAGGALGGLLVAVVAPAVLHEFRELEIGLWALGVALGVVCFRQRSRSLVRGAAVGAMAATLVVPWLRAPFKGSGSGWEELLAFYRLHGWLIAGGLGVLFLCLMDVRRRRMETEWQPRMGGFVMLLVAGLGAIFVVEWRDKHETPILSASRNFYGTLKVFDYSPDDPEQHYRLLMHGATTHGLQFVSPKKAVWPTSYYGEHSGIGLALRHLPRETGRRIGVVGLGTGTLAAYGRVGDYLRIYDINPAVERLARSAFTYLARCPAKVDVIMGDARLSMEHELAGGQSQQFDLLALDAFSSDAIPVHLLTREAVEIYLRHLRPDGVLVVHISNRYLDLAPVVDALAQHFGLHSASISDDYETEWWFYDSTWILLTKDAALLAGAEILEATEDPPAKKHAPVLWTDDHASLYEILK